MTTTVELSTPLSAFPLSGVFQASPPARVVFEPVVHRSGAGVWSFRVHDIDPATLEEVFDGDGYVRRSRIADTGDNRALIEVTWEPGLETTATTAMSPKPSRDRTPDRTEVEIGSSAERVLLEALGEHDVTILALSGTKRGWEFTLRFPDREATKAFQTAALTAGHSFSVTRVCDADGNRDRDGCRAGGAIDLLTSAQREAFTLALQRGYFAIPRQTTLVEVSEELGISDQAASERLRRAQAKLGRAATGSKQS